MSQFPQLYPAENKSITRPAPRPGPVIGGMAPGVSPYPPFDTSHPGAGSGYSILTIDLTTATANREFDIAGKLFSYWDTTVPATDTITIRFDSVSADPIPFRYGKTWEVRPFTRVFVSWAATPGSVATLAILPSNSEVVVP